MSNASRNGSELRRILEHRTGTAVLHRTCIAGPSGQRSQVPVAQVAYTWHGPFELAVWCPPGHDCHCDEPAGYLARMSHPQGEWTVWGPDPRGEHDGYWLNGWTDSPALGADILIHGEHAARANHDHARVSQASWVRYDPAQHDRDHAP